jgi:hypothetical protein
MFSNAVGGCWLKKGEPVYIVEYLTGKVGFPDRLGRHPRSPTACKIAFELPDPAAIAPAALTT